MMWLKFLCICAIIANVYGQAISKFAEIAQGPVRGYRDTNYEDIFVFYNIPYATVPSGADKFKAPLPPPTWNNTFHANNRGIACPQTMLQPLPYERTEDCLVANVHVPDTQETDLPVLVIIHQASFLTGHSHMNSPNYLVDSKKVIAVTFNYRMGANGFLCLGTETAPGNAGMKDQVALLRWVRENIRQFGGDPDNVTIGGCLFGVDLLVLSKMTDGLFHKVISDSQCSLSNVEYDPFKMAQNRAVDGFNLQNSNDIASLEEFYTIYTSLLTNDIIRGLGEFMPCVEKDIGQEIFLEDAPINILRNGSFKKVPTLFGWSKKEAYRYENFLSVKDEMNNDFQKFLPRDLKFENDQTKMTVADAAKEFYFAGQVNDTDLLAFINYFTDLDVYPMLRAVALQLNAGNNHVYLSEFSFPDDNSPDMSPINEVGAYLCDQFSTVFGRVGLQPSEERLAMAETLRDIYVNFITTGNPTPAGWNSSLPAWLPVSTSNDRSPHYSMGETFQLAGAPIPARAAFWDGVYQENDIRVPIPPNAAHSSINSIIWNVSALIALLAYR